MYDAFTPRVSISFSRWMWVYACLNSHVCIYKYNRDDVDSRNYTRIVWYMCSKSAVLMPAVLYSLYSFCCIFHFVTNSIRPKYSGNLVNFAGCLCVISLLHSQSFSSYCRLSEFYCGKCYALCIFFRFPSEMVQAHVSMHLIIVNSFRVIFLLCWCCILI